MGNTLNIGGVDVGGRVWIAPMTGVSDLPFRRAASRLGASYVATEMVAAAELARVAGRPLDAELQAWVHGTDDLPLAELIAHFGVRWSHDNPSRKIRRRQVTRKASRNHRFLIDL